MGEYIYSNLFLISGQLLATPILFIILYGVLVDIAVANLYSLLFINNATFSVCYDQSVELMLFPVNIAISHMRLSYSCL